MRGSGWGMLPTENACCDQVEGPQSRWTEEAVVHNWHKWSDNEDHNASIVVLPDFLHIRAQVQPWPKAKLAGTEPVSQFTAAGIQGIG